MKELYDEKCLENEGSTRFTLRQLKLKWIALQVPLGRFNEIYTRRTIEWGDREENAIRGMNYDILCELIDESCAEYARL